METKRYTQLNDDIIKLRTVVFMKEQGFENEFDKQDEDCIFIVAYDDDKAVGMCRFFSDDQKHYHLGRVCVLKEYRKQGVGKLVVEETQRQVKELNGEEIVLSAQSRVKDFYTKLGYEAFGEEYYDEHCLHVDMMMKL